jgi:hypothetical protein
LPAAAVINIFVVRGVAWYRESDLFSEPDPDVDPRTRPGADPEVDAPGPDGPDGPDEPAT